MISIILKVMLLIGIVVFPFLWTWGISKTLETYFGHESCYGEDKIIRNLYLYRKYAIGTIPNYWFTKKAMNKWNSYLCKLCNTSPENSKRFSFMKKNGLNVFYVILFFSDAFWWINEKI